MAIRHVLVTGSEGYIGTTVTQKLLQKGYIVTGIDTCYYSKSKTFNKHPHYQFIQKDVRDVSKKDLISIDAIIHLAALSNDPLGALNSSLTNKINYKSTVRLAKLAKEVGIQRFLYSSSCSIYGIAKNGIVNERSMVNPLTEYARSKIKSEKQLKKLASKKFCVGILRNSTVYGYSQNFRNDLVVNNLVLSAVQTNNIKILSDGTPWRPLIDVRDLSEIFIQFLFIDQNKINGKVINIGFPKNNFQVKDIADLIHKQLPKTKITYAFKQALDSRSYKVDFSLFRKLFPHITQQWPLKRSISDLIEVLKYKKPKTGHLSRLSELSMLRKKQKLDEDLRWT